MNPDRLSPGNTLSEEEPYSLLSDRVFDTSEGLKGYDRTKLKTFLRG